MKKKKSRSEVLVFETRVGKIILGGPSWRPVEKTSSHRGGQRRGQARERRNTMAKGKKKKKKKKKKKDDDGGGLGAADDEYVAASFMLPVHPLHCDRSHDLH